MTGPIKNRKILHIYDKTLYYIKNHRLLSTLWSVLTVLIIILLIALDLGWGVDKNKLGYYFDPEVTQCSDDSVMALIENYYISYIAGDTEAVKNISLDPENVEAIVSKDQMIEFFDNIHLHWAKSIDENTYVLYAYWEVKFSGIETKAPGIEMFYIVKNEDVYLIKNKLNEEEMEYLNALNKTDSVTRLNSITDKNLEEALQNKDLKDFYDFLLKASKSN